MTLSPGSLTYNDMIRYEVTLVNEGLGGQAQARPLSYLGPDNKRGSKLAVNKKLGRGRLVPSCIWALVKYLNTSKLNKVGVGTLVTFCIWALVMHRGSQLAVYLIL